MSEDNFSLPLARAASSTGARHGGVNTTQGRWRLRELREELHECRVSVVEDGFRDDSTFPIPSDYAREVIHNEYREAMRTKL